MEEKDIKKLLEPLKKIAPDENWMISCRSKLAFRMEMERKKHILDKDLSILDGLFAFLGNKSPKPTLKWAYALSIGFLVIAAGGGATAWAAKHSLPGSALYPMKIALEKLRLEASFSSEGKIKLQTEMTNARLQELQKVVLSSENPEKKKGKVEQVVNEINQQLNKANNQLPGMGDAESQKTVAAAKAISESAVKTEKMISQMKESLPSELKENLGGRLTEAAETADRMGTKALGIIVRSQIQSEDSSEISARIMERIEVAEERIKVIGQKVESVSSSTIADNSSSVNISADKLPVIRAVLIKDQSEKARELIEQAKSSLEDNDMAQALETLNLARTIILGAEKIADSDLVKILFEEGVLKPDSKVNIESNEGINASSTVPAAND
ncbi:MAG: hypothetical protein UV67_C0008G0008 [Parcubacteria group bacterium GW2011_GWC1_43_12]|nr:MAG: hypothetical protein UV34_C0013G0002 [Parcubacteria group bacterium GW2011_GWB1_42_6]KKS92186.1 MAG: hypothetical protein UV67_C0008G0008 [Parcubacteria group bacterium GW2011_GWC1_43_12]